MEMNSKSAEILSPYKKAIQETLVSEFLLALWTTSKTQPGNGRLKKPRWCFFRCCCCCCPYFAPQRSSHSYLGIIWYVCPNFWDCCQHPDMAHLQLMLDHHVVYLFGKLNAVCVPYTALIISLCPRIKKHPSIVSNNQLQTGESKVKI